MLLMQCMCFLHKSAYMLSNWVLNILPHIAFIIAKGGLKENKNEYNNEPHFYNEKESPNLNSTIDINNVTNNP